MLPPLPPDTRKTLLFLCWRDIKAPKRGGAEVFTHEMLRRVDAARFRVLHLSPLFPGASPDELIDGVRYLRAGGTLSVIGEARKFYGSNAQNVDFVIDQCNTHRFFTPLWAPAPKRIFFIHQLTREIWHLMMKAPASYLGAWTETPFLRLSRRDATFTVSNSTRQDLLDIGFAPERVTILPEGIDFKHWDPSEFLPKEPVSTFVYVGRFSRYKGIDDVVDAFGHLRRNGRAKLQIIGKTNLEYVETALRPIMERHNLTWGERDKDGMDNDVTFFGFVSEEEKLERMSRSHALMFPSKREGWGLIVTEAAAVGTPSIVYNAPGIVDAVDQGRAGYLTRTNSVEGLVERMREVVAGGAAYEQMRAAAYRYALNFHWDHTADHFHRFMNGLLHESAPQTVAPVESAPLTS